MGSFSKFEEAIASAQRGNLVRPNSTIVNPENGFPVKTFDYVASVNLSDSSGDSGHVATVALVSDDGCDVFVNGDQWLNECEKGHDINEGVRRYGKLLVPGDDNCFKIKYSQTFYDPDVLADDLDGLSLIVFPMEIDVSVRDSTGKENDRILVRRGEVIDVALNPIFWRYDLPSNDAVRWELGQVGRDGRLTWRRLEERGAKISVQMSNAGIFQIRANIKGREYYYLRHQSVPNSTDSRLQKKAADFVGVYRFPFQKKMVAAAYPHAKSASAAFAKAAKIDLSKYGAVQPEGDYEGRNKCNIFVFVVSYEAGVKNELLERGYKYVPFVSGYYTSPTTVSEWKAESVVKCAPTPFWIVSLTNPEPGQIVLGHSHMGVLDYDGFWINAGTSRVHKNLFLSQEEKYKTEQLNVREAN